MEPTARKTNQEVIQRVGVSRGVMTIMRKRQIGFPAHILRKNALETSYLLGMKEGKITIR